MKRARPSKKVGCSGLGLCLEMSGERERSFKKQRSREHIPVVVFHTHSPTRPMVQKFPAEPQNRKVAKWWKFMTSSDNSWMTHLVRKGHFMCFGTIEKKAGKNKPWYHRTWINMTSWPSKDMISLFYLKIMISKFFDDVNSRKFWRHMLLASFQ